MILWCTHAQHARGEWRLGVSLTMSPRKFDQGDDAQCCGRRTKSVGTALEIFYFFFLDGSKSRLVEKVYLKKVDQKLG